MANIITGRLNLTKIPADLIRTDNNGNQFIWVDVVERQTPGTYGDTHYVSIYDKERQQRIYLGDLRPRDFGGSAGTDEARPSAFPTAPKPTPAPAPAPRPMNNGKAEYYGGSVNDEDMPAI